MNASFHKKERKRDYMMGSEKEFHVSSEIANIAEIVPNKLFFGVTYSSKTELIKNTDNDFYFNIDDEFVYLNYYFDFGPLNISCLYKYCVKLQSYINCPQIYRIIHYTSSNPARHVNGAFLFASFAIIYLGMEPKVVYRKLIESGGKFKYKVGSISSKACYKYCIFRQFLDASQIKSPYTIKLQDCLYAIEKANKLNFFDFDDFNEVEYDLYDKIQNGDFNWLVPRKFIALIGPIDKSISSAGHAPNFYIKYFLKNDVRTVIRLNNKLYDSYDFEQAGINHYDLYFPDGTTPSKTILIKFLQIAENCNGAIAVHCKAGLGRTGCLIGAYIIKHYKFSAREAIAWMRICRPGCVIGQQQAWLEKIESWLWKQGMLYRLQNYGEDDKVVCHKYGIYSKIWQIQQKKMLLLHKKVNFNVLPTAKHNKYVNVNGQVSNESYTKDLKKTQGDHLNEIKMRNYQM